MKKEEVEPRMNRFLQKVKDGASKASEKAQNVMEQNRVQGQIDAKHKQWKQNTYEIGCIAYEAYKEERLSSLKEQFEELAKENVQLEQEMEQLEWKRCELRNEKRCSCGQVADWGANFCAKCGSKLPEPPRMNVESAAAMDKTDLWETQVLHPFRHNEASVPHVLDKEDTVYYFNSEDDQSPQHYPTSAVKGEGSSLSSSGTEPLSLNSADQTNTRREEAAWTWSFPEREPLSRSGKPSQSGGSMGNKYATLGKICTHCGASAEEEAKWCERCGTPFV